MSHLHNVKDDDLLFVIDPSTRAITNKAGIRTTIMQFDHNSEELVFELPKVIEGHDMALCDTIQVHFKNIGTGTSVSTRQINTGIYTIQNLTASEDDPNILLCSWLVKQEATQLYGTIEFSIRFTCADNEDAGISGYIWNTDICNTVDVKKSINNGPEIAEIYPDVLTQFEERLSDLEQTGVTDADIKAALDDYFSENPAIAVDPTLTISGAAADAKVTGDTIGAVNTALQTILNGEVS